MYSNLYDIYRYKIILGLLYMLLTQISFANLPDLKVYNFSVTQSKILPATSTESVSSQ
jgi:hypothetical protein